MTPISRVRRAGLLALGFVATAGLAIPGVAAAVEGYPNKSIRLMVPYPPGGGNDVLARMIAPRLAEQLKQQVYIENKGGAGGTIGTALAAQAAPDGYSILIVNALPHTSAAGLYPSLGYDPLKSFAAVGQFATTPYMLAVHPKVPAQTAKEFIALVHAQPGKLQYASAGTGSAPHLAAESFKAATKADIMHIPYKGGGPAMTDLIAGQTQATFENIAILGPYLKQGTLRGLVVTGPKRSSLLPSVPTMRELGYEGFDVSGKFGFVVPAGTPASIVEVLNTALNRALGDPELAKQLTAQGAEVTTGSAADFDKLLRQESDLWLRLIRDAGIKNE